MKVVWFLIVINYSVLGQTQSVLWSENVENTEPSTSQTNENFSNYIKTPKEETTTTDISTSTSDSATNIFFTSTSSTNENFSNNVETSPTLKDEGITATDISTSTSDSTTTTFTSTSSTTENQCNKDLQITNLAVEPYSFNATITWDPPEDAKECIEMYQVLVYLDNSLIQNITVKPMTSLTIPELTACESYTVKVEVKQFDENNPNTPVEKNFTTVPPDPFEYSVEDLSFNIRSDDFLIATWKPPTEKVSKCVTSYEYNLQEGETSSSNSTSDTSIPELKTVGCRNYEITVTPIVNETINGSPQTTNFSVSPIPTNPPQLLENSAEKNSISISWRIDNKESNECPLSQMVVTCNATEENGNFTWIIISGEAVLNISSIDPNNFSMIVDNLSPFTNYTCDGFVKNTGGDSNITNFKIQTSEDVPSAPDITSVVPTSTNINIKWDLPAIIPGNLASYNLTIKNEGPNFQIPDNCKGPDNTTEYLYYPSAEKNEFNFNKAFPYHNYTILIFGVTGAGNGNVSTQQITTKPSQPEPVKNTKFSDITYSRTDKYSAQLTLQFEPPCYINGAFKSYQIIMNGTRDGFGEDTIRKVTDQTTIEINLKPDRHYSGEILVQNQDFTSNSSRLGNIQSNPGVPGYVDSVLEPPTSNDTTRAYFTLKKSAFDDTNGAILYYALFLLPKSEHVEGADYGFWKDDNWTNILEDYQITPFPWNPFKDGLDTIDFIIGEAENCSSSGDYCNKALKENTNYSLIVRALTNTTYRDSWPLHFKTDVLDQLDLGLILGLVFGLLALLLIAGFMLYLWRRKRKTLIDEEETRFSSSSPTPIPCKKFVEYYNNIKENNNIIKSQYQALGNLGKEIAAATPTTYALLPENRRKNRYTNILPYDTTRVKLNIDEDDEISSDYINASYIKGFSGRNEYIATQGPLEATSKDFWKMVVQENVTIIMMVSQFVEQSKEKCFQYFPNNHETLNFGESLEVRCSTELHFGTHCIRTLQVRKDNEQRNVIHMQFLEWPDFGVPQSTDNMLQFCHQMREKANAEGGLIVIHCSAGVGRTGTLIALDILLQTIDNHRDIDIYKTVLNLRKQRTNMVQTEKQYMFLHTCVHEYIQAPTINSNDQEQDHLYENMDILRSSLKETLIETDVESAL